MPTQLCMLSLHWMMCTKLFKDLDVPQVDMIIGSCKESVHPNSNVVSSIELPFESSISKLGIYEPFQP